MRYLFSWSRRLPPMAAALALLGACGSERGGAGPSAATFDTLSGGVVRVTNHAPADSGQWSLVLERTIQPADDSAGALRAPDDLLLLDDGSLLVADSKPAEVMRFDAGGRYVGSIGREGAGPGEYRSPYLAMRGDTLVVHDPSLSRAVMFSLVTSQVFTQRMTTPRYFAKVDVDGGGRAVAPMMAPPDSTAGPRSAFVRFSLDGSRIDTVFMPERPRGDARWIVREGKLTKFEMLVPLQPRDVHAVDPTGGFITGWSGAFTLRATRDGRDTVRLISRPENAGTISADEKAAIVDAKVLEVKGQAPEAVLRASLVASAIPDARPSFEHVQVDRSGRIWARRSTSDTTTLQFDLFDRDGRWLDVLQVDASQWTRTWWAPVSFSRDGVAVVIEDADGRPAVLVYRLTRR